MKWISVFIALLLTTSMAPAQSGPTFRKLRFGVPVAKQVPRCAADQQGLVHDVEQTCWSCMEIISLSKPYCSVYFKDAFPVREMITEEDQRGLASLRILDEFNASTVAEILTSRYGKPSESVLGELRTGLGVSVPQKQIVWKSNGLVIRLVSPLDKVTTSQLSVYPRDAWNTQQNKARDAAKKAADDL